MPALPPPVCIDQIESTGKRTQSGALGLPSGSAPLPGLTIGGYGWFYNPAVPPAPLGPAAMVCVTTGARRTAMIWDYGFKLAGFTELAWSDQGGMCDKPETGLALHHDHNNELAQRNGSAAQSYALYNTWSSASIFERLNIGWAVGVAKITTQKGTAGGVAHDLVLGADDADQIRLSPGGKIGLFGAAPVTQPVSAALTNNLPSCGTDDVVDDFVDGDWAGLRAALFQTTKKLKEAHDALRALGALG